MGLFSIYNFFIQDIKIDQYGSILDNTIFAIEKYSCFCIICTFFGGHNVVPSNMNTTEYVSFSIIGFGIDSSHDQTDNRMSVII